MLYMWRLREQTYRLPCAQLVRLVEPAGAFYHDKCFFAERKTRLYDIERVPGVALLHTFGKRAFTHLLQILLKVFFALPLKESA